jgi:hypothetical protein
MPWRSLRVILHSTCADAVLLRQLLCHSGVTIHDELIRDACWAGGGTAATGAEKTKIPVFCPGQPLNPSAPPSTSREHRPRSRPGPPIRQTLGLSSRLALICRRRVAECKLWRRKTRFAMLRVVLRRLPRNHVERSKPSLSCPKRNDIAVLPHPHHHPISPCRDCAGTWLIVFLCFISALVPYAPPPLSLFSRRQLPRVDYPDRRCPK